MFQEFFGEAGIDNVRRTDGRCQLNSSNYDWDALEGAMRKHLDAEAVASWVHPADAMDGEVHAQQSDMASRAATLEALRRILSIVVPPPGSRDGNRWRAAFGRFMALVYIVTPEYAEGMTMRELAIQLRVDERTLRLRMSAVRRALGRGIGGK